MKQERSWRTYIQVFIFIMLLCIFYKLDFPIHIIILIGIIILLLIILKGKIYKKLDVFLTKRFSFLSRLNPRTKKLIIILTVILVYVLLKQIIFFILKMFGIDFQKMITDSIGK